jgi:uncharacterized protein (DUF2252 family)
MPANDVVAATRSYERWLSAQTSVVGADLRRKRSRMDEDPFVFLRATYYWWVTQWPEVLPALAAAPTVHAVGDLHMENFGTWRDAEGRLIWGINDFDETHTAPYTSDLVRLATSVLLAARTRKLRIPPGTACQAIVDGYTANLARGGRPIVLAEQRRWLRAIAIEQLKDPAPFWKNLVSDNTCAKGEYPAAIVKAAMPDRRLAHQVHHRIAGVGSLGRPRFVAVAQLGGAYIARELKAVVPPASVWAAGTRTHSADVMWLLEHSVRVPDPFYRFGRNWITRRLAPDCTKLDIHAMAEAKDQSRLMRAMGTETANIHLASPTRAVVADLERRPAGWLHSAASVMADAMAADWRTWKQR